MVSVDAASATLTAAASLCSSTLYPALGVITLPDLGLPITLAEPLVQQVPCVPLLPRADSQDGGSSSSGSSSAESKQGATTSVTPITTSASAEAAAVTKPTSTDDGNITISDIVVTATTGTATASATLNFHNGDDNPKTVHISSFGDPFYLSTSPIIYALSACTIVSWMLVIALFITTRSTFDGGIVYLGSRGSFTGSSSSGGISIGGRPWLQKIAALTVAISLTIATADTMSIVKDQYIWGVTNARQLQRDVMSRMELKVIRIISDTFLWLAQAQTLIRLFPRHREKVVIKWVAFALISLDIVFSSLNSFPFGEYDILNGNYSDPNENGDGNSNKGLAHPIPAISYVFKLSLGLLYFFWVSYYAFLKRRYAFYHPLMKNISLVAVISLLAITVPIVFFILDISKPNFTAWGDYVRWVGAAAASVVVWEWVERIEALEREEKKDGVLGREVYDGDDMLEINAAEYPWRHKHGKFGGSGSSGGSHGMDLEGGQLHHRSNGHALGPGGFQNGQTGPTSHEHEGRSMGDILRPQLWSQRAAQAATPISRTDTPSAASTVYAVRYQGESRTPEPPMPYYTHTSDLARHPSGPHSYSEDAHDARSHNGRGTGARYSPDTTGDAAHVASEISREPSTTVPPRARIMRSVSYSNEPEVQDGADDQHTVTRAMDFNTITAGSRGGRGGRWDIRGRLEDFAASQADRFRDKFHPSTDTDKLPVTVVPAPPRVGAALQQVLEEDEEGSEARRQHQPAQSPSQAGSIYGGSSAIDAAASTASERYANAPTRSSPARSRPSPLPLPVNQPPLWPGVNRRAATLDDEDDDESFEGEEDEEDEGQSTTDDVSSVLSRERPHGSSASRTG
ncbi:PalH/RIM21-like protein [Cordyceps fumosorosea ARSEF 2679]|uniref:PalH/RIM21-like protein n=1 Tax=Cordyceps fumosorosea (strain ARSEF 2679) TaxID=1081104 RepID=A0A168CH16_CORFA|nr:PalH/RIM21-like protein [Cordyceps fumosorosea ARSEF 2679]OAA71367.1 PalH/RIM21-like protein [Cordyceps fumosorosea ARSEF 2679]